MFLRSLLSVVSIACFFSSLSEAMDGVGIKTNNDTNKDIQSKTEEPKSLQEKFAALCSTILKLLSGCPEEGIKQSLDDAFFLCQRVMVKGFPDVGLTEFKKSGVYKAIETLADGGNPGACYIMSGLLYADAVNQKKVPSSKVLDYLRKARNGEPLAYPLLLRCVPRTEWLALGEEIYTIQAPINKNLRVYLAEAMKKRCEMLWSYYMLVLHKDGQVDTSNAEWQEASAVFLQLLNWYAVTQEPCTSLQKLCNEAREIGLTSQFVHVGSSAIDYLKTMSCKDALFSYELGMLFFSSSAPCADDNDELQKRKEAVRREAYDFWCAARQLDHLPSAFLLVASDKARSAEHARRAVECMETTLADHPIEECTMLQIKRTIGLYIADACTGEDLRVCGELYSTGINGVLDADATQAVSYYKRSYLTLFENESKKISLATFIKNAGSQLAKSREHIKRKKNARKALTEILNDCDLENLNLQQLVDVAMILAYGIAGEIEPSTNRLIQLLEIVTKKFTDVATLQKFVAETKLAKLPPTQHPEAHYFIVACKLSHEKLSEKDVEAALQRLETLESACRKSKSHLLLTLGTLKRGREYAASHTDYQCAGFFALCLAERFNANQLNNEHVQELYETFNCVSKMLEGRLQKKPPFYKGGKYFDTLKRALKQSMESTTLPSLPAAASSSKENSAAQQKTTGIMAKRLYSLLQMLVDADFMEGGFVEGVITLYELAAKGDTISKNLLDSLFLLHKDWPESLTKHPIKKLGAQLAMAIACLFSHTLLDATILWRDGIEFARAHNIKQYKELCEHWDPSAYENLFLKQEVMAQIDTRVLASVGLAAHYSFLADLSTAKEKQRYQKKADAYLAKGLSIKRSIMNIIMGSEYITGKMFARNVEKAEACFNEASKSFDIAMQTTENLIEMRDALEASLRIIEDLPKDKQPLTLIAAIQSKVREIKTHLPNRGNCTNIVMVRA